MELGLKRGTAKILPHQPEWRANAAETIEMLKTLLGGVAVDIQHVGSTAIPAIHAKPIIDLAVGLRDLQDIQPYIRPLEQAGVYFRGEDVPGQMLFVMGDLEKEFRTHHVHMVQWNSAAWNNYLNFRDYLNAFPEKAAAYDACKQDLAARFPHDRRRYTAGKHEIIDRLLEEARRWRAAGSL